MNSAIEFQARALRTMTADEKVRVSQALWEEMWEVLAAGVRELLRDVRAFDGSA